MPQYKVKHTSIMHNKSVYAEGSVIELTEIQAQRLVDFLELLPETETTAKTTKPKTEVSAKSKTNAKTSAKTGDATPRTSQTTETPAIGVPTESTVPDGTSESGGNK